MVVTASIAISCDVEVGPLLRGVWKDIDAPLLKSKSNLAKNQEKKLNGPKPVLIKDHKYLWDA